MDVGARGGAEQVAGVVFHTDRGSTSPATSSTALYRRLQIRQSMGRVGSCFDNAAAEVSFSSPEWKVLSRHDFTSTRQAQAVVMDWCYGFYNHQRRHSAAGGQSPINYDIAALNRKSRECADDLIGDLLALARVGMAVGPAGRWAQDQAGRAAVEQSPLRQPWPWIDCRTRRRT